MIIWFGINLEGNDRYYSLINIFNLNNVNNITIPKLQIILYITKLINLYIILCYYKDIKYLDHPY